jgi:hypothetical protein
MSGTTIKGYPYPTGTDRVADGDNAIQALAEKIDTVAPFAIAAGTVPITPPPAPGGVSTAITFPASRFTQAPICSITAHSNGYGAGSGSGTTTTAVTARFWSLASTPTGAAMHWVAVQMLPGAAPGLRALPDTHTATCHTEGCGNAGIEIPVALEEPDMAVVCGVCSQPITDLTAR